MGIRQPVVVGELDGLALRYGAANVDPPSDLVADSVILRDPTGKVKLQVLEQSYRNDPVSQQLLLSLFEGKTIKFEKFMQKDGTQVREMIPGKIIRSGHVPGGGLRDRSALLFRKGPDGPGAAKDDDPSGARVDELVDQLA